MNYLVSAFGHKYLINIFDVRKNDNPNRYMDPQNDIYPPPLMSNSPSYKHKGYSKLQMAILYLQPQRIKEIILDHQDDIFNLNMNNLNMDNLLTSYNIDIDELKSIINTHDYSGYFTNLLYDIEFIDIYARIGYYGNIIDYLCGSSLKSNIMHDNNEYVFDKCFMSILQTLKLENIPHMVNNKSLMHICDSAYIYGFILLNYGATFESSEQKKFFIENLKHNYIKSFYLSEKLDKIISSKLPIGSKLMEIVETCPITNELITCPVIIEDGSIYEKEFILKWFNSGKNTSPLSGIKLKKFWIMYDILNDEIVYANNKIIFPTDVSNFIK